MNVKELINTIKQTAVRQQPIKSVYDGDVYENWNSGEVKYGSFNIGLQSADFEGQQMSYTFVFYYGDRLLQDKRNTNEIYSDAVLAIQSVINSLNQNGNIEIADPIQYQFFQQRFFDFLAGAYCTVTITTDSELGLCGIDDFGDLTDELPTEEEPDTDPETENEQTEMK